jgi:dipeptidase
MVARLPAEKDGLLCYWGCLGSPCIGVFLPYYIDGHIPPALARGGRAATEDSPWWKFKKLLDLVERDFARYTPIASAQWKTLEQEIDKQATDVEAEALAQQRAGRANTASDLLTRFMSDNVTKVLHKLDELIIELESNPPPPTPNP